MFEIKCLTCKGQNVVKRGLSPTANRGKQQRYLCKTCKKTFIQDLGFWRMRNNEKIITMSIDLYLSNLSSRKMRNQLKRHMDTKASHVSILDWVRKYVLKVQNYVEKLDYKVGGAFYADETFIRRGTEDDRFWACVDWETRLITGIHYSLAGNPEEAMEFIKKAISKGKPKFIQTDAAGFYPKAFHKLFYSKYVASGNRKDKLTIKHRIQNYSRTGIHNYKIETVFMKIKDRVHDFRGLKALWSAPILMAGITLQHNWIEPHTTTKQIPAELAGINQLKTSNRWLELIKIANC